MNFGLIHTVTGKHPVNNVVAKEKHQTLSLEDAVEPTINKRQRTQIQSSPTPSSVLLDVVLALCEECTINCRSPLPKKKFMMPKRFLLMVCKRNVITTRSVFNIFLICKILSRTISNSAWVEGLIIYCYFWFNHTSTCQSKSSYKIDGQSMNDHCPESLTHWTGSGVCRWWAHTYCQRSRRAHPQNAKDAGDNNMHWKKLLCRSSDRGAGRAVLMPMQSIESGSLSGHLQEIVALPMDRSARRPASRRQFMRDASTVYMSMCTVTVACVRISSTCLYMDSGIIMQFW
jgi:hypothetical protein